MSEIIGTWIAAGLTLCIFSFLYRDNPFYKFAEHLYVGSSAAYMFVYLYFFDIKPMLIDKFIASTGVERWILILPGLFSIMMLLRLIPKISWLSRWSIAFTVGIGSGLGITMALQGYVIPQLRATFLPMITKNLFLSINNIILIIGTITTIMYFYFSKEHTGKFMGPVRIGMAFIMVAFGASFGYTVMARLSLLIGRIHFLLYNWLKIIK